MPYEAKGKCVYKKDGGAKVGCTKGSVKDYLGALYANADESIEEEEKLVGGKADNKSAEDIAKKHSTSVDKIKDQLRKGIESEKKEHTNDTKAAKEMAADHLDSYPNYYNNITSINKAAAKNKKINKDAAEKTAKALKEDMLPGGKADDKTPEEIAQYNGVSVGEIERQINLGTRIELEHVENEQEAREIAMDHLMEIPDYYDRLIKMEKQAAAERTLREGTENSKLLIKRLIRENLDKK